MAATFDPKFCPANTYTLVHNGAGFATAFIISNTSGSDATISFWDTNDVAGTAAVEIKLSVQFPTGGVPHTAHMPKPYLRFQHGLVCHPGAGLAAIWGEGS